MADEPSDLELLRRFARTRDDEAFGRLMARHAPMLRHVARHHTGNEAAADDVTQAAFLVLTRRPRAALRSTRRKQSLRPWLTKVVGYAASAWRRGEARRARRERAAAKPETVRPTHPTDTADTLAVALANLTRGERRLLEWRHGHGMSWPEVALHAGTTPDAARKSAARALGRLRDMLPNRAALGLPAAVATLLRPSSATASTLAARLLAQKVMLTMRLQQLATSATFTACVVLAGGGWFALAQETPAEPTTAATSAAPSAAPPASRPAAAEPPPLAVDLGNGGRVEVVAVVEHKPDGRAWHADGTPIAGRPMALPFYAQEEDLLEVWVRLTGGESGEIRAYGIGEGVVDGPIWEQQIPEGDPAAREKRTQAMREMNDAQLLLILMRPQPMAKAVGARVEVPVQPWQTLQQWGTGVEPMKDRLAWIGGSIGEGSLPFNGRPAQVTTRWFVRGMADWQIELWHHPVKGLPRMIDGAGTPNMISGTDMQVGQTDVRGYFFDDLGHFEMRGRVTAWVTLTGLSVAPGLPTKPSGQLGDAPTAPWESD